MTPGARHQRRPRTAVLAARNEDPSGRRPKPSFWHPGSTAGHSLPDSHRRARRPSGRADPNTVGTTPTPPAAPNHADEGGHLGVHPPPLRAAGRRLSPHHLEENRSGSGTQDPPPPAATVGPHAAPTAVVEQPPSESPGAAAMPGAQGRRRASAGDPLAREGGEPGDSGEARGRRVDGGGG